MDSWYLSFLAVNDPYFLLLYQGFQFDSDTTESLHIDLGDMGHLKWF